MKQTFNAVELSAFNELGVKIKATTGIEIKLGRQSEASANGYKLRWDYDPLTKHLEIEVLAEPNTAMPESLSKALDKWLGQGLDGRDKEERS